jgi:hypothetical protein
MLRHFFCASFCSGVVYVFHPWTVETNGADSLLEACQSPAMPEEARYSLLSLLEALAKLAKGQQSPAKPKEVMRSNSLASRATNGTQRAG